MSTGVDRRRASQIQAALPLQGYPRAPANEQTSAVARLMPGGRMAEDDKAFQDFLAELQAGSLTYDQVKKRYLELGDQIKDRYEREYTAISVDVVQSVRTKASGGDLDAQLTFDAYHAWVDQKLQAHGCRNATWSGDGLLAIFEQPDAAVGMARALIDELPRFNNDRRRNRLPLPLQIRAGIHTGPILPGESEGLGKIASRTFDLAGHLQKSAAPNKILISETTYALIREGAGQFTPAHVELPNPSACFVYPADSGDAGVYTPAAALAAPMPPRTAPPPAAGGSTLIPWVLAGAAVIVAAGVTVVVLRNSKPTPVGAASAQATGFGRRPISVPGAGAGSTPPAPEGANGGAAAPAPPVAPGSGQAVAPTVSAWEPSRTPWRSPAAEKGMPPSFVAATPERKWILAVGVGRFQDKGLTADGAGNDAAFVATALQRASGVPADHVRLVADERATRDGIKQGFQWLQQSATSGEDTAYVYLTGAAALVPGNAGSTYALAAHDSTAADVGGSGIRGGDIAAWLGATRAQTVVVLVDTSFSGAIDAPPQSDPGRQWGFITAGSAVQRTGPGRSSAAGPFAEALAAGVQGAADANRDRRVSLAELRAYLTAEVSRRTGGALVPEAKAGYLPDVGFGG